LNQIYLNLESKMTTSGEKVCNLNIPNLKMSNGQEIPVLGIGTSRVSLVFLYSLMHSHSKCW